MWPGHWPEDGVQPKRLRAAVGSPGLGAPFDENPTLRGESDLSRVKYVFNFRVARPGLGSS